MSKRPNLLAGFTNVQEHVVHVKSDEAPKPQPTPIAQAVPAVAVVDEQTAQLPAPIPQQTPITVETPQPTPTRIRKNPRANHQAFTVWLDKDLVSSIRTLSRDLVDEGGRAGNSIEALVTQALKSVLKKHGRV